MKKKFLIIMVLFISIITIGCGKNKPNYEKHLISFSYSYGTIKEGIYDYSITLEDGLIIYRASASNNEFPYTEKKLEKTNIDSIDEVIKEYDVLDWDGFNKHDKVENNDEISFSIQIGYDDGSFKPGNYMTNKSTNKAIWKR